MRKTNMLKPLAVAGLALGILAAMQSVSHAQDIKLGTILPISGPSGVTGQHVAQGIELAVKQLNADGGLLGRKIEWLLRDDESVPAVGVSRATELVADGIDMHVGGYNSPVSLAHQPVLARADIGDINVIAKVDQVLTSGVNPLAVKISSANSSDGEILARILLKKVKAKKIAFLTQNDVYGESTEKSIRAGLDKIGQGEYEIALTEKFPLTQTDFRNILENVRNSGADAIMLTSASQESGVPAFLQQKAELDLKIPVVEIIGGIAEVTLQIAGDAAEGAYSVDIYDPNKPPFDSIPASVKFKEAYKAKFGADPDHFAASGYIGVQLWAEAVRQTKSLDKTTVMSFIRGHTFPDAIFGPKYTVHEDGQGDGVYIPFQVIDGKRTAIEIPE